MTNYFYFNFYDVVYLIFWANYLIIQLKLFLSLFPFIYALGTIDEVMYIQITIFLKAVPVKIFLIYFTITKTFVAW